MTCPLFWGSAAYGRCLVALGSTAGQGCAEEWQQPLGIIQLQRHLAHVSRLLRQPDYQEQVSLGSQWSRKINPAVRTTTPATVCVAGYSSGCRHAQTVIGLLWRTQRVLVHVHMVMLPEAKWSDFWDNLWKHFNIENLGVLIVLHPWAVVHFFIIMNTQTNNGATDSSLSLISQGRPWNKVANGPHLPMCLSDQSIHPMKQLLSSFILTSDPVILGSRRQN